MTSPISPSNLKSHETYYISSGDLVILVENILFRVHRYFFERESEYFKTFFETPLPDNQPLPGSSDSSALLLEAVTASRFARFLWVFYNPKFSIYDEATVDDWKSILELSDRWIFPEVKELAIRELGKKDLTSVERIELYHRTHVDRKHLVRDYLSLCQRPDPLTLQEGLDLGLETTLMIAQTREEIRSPRSPDGVKAPFTPVIDGQELIRFIGKVFVTAENKTPTTQESNGHAMHTPDADKQANGTTGASSKTEPEDGEPTSGDPSKGKNNKANGRGQQADGENRQKGRGKSK